MARAYEAAETITPRIRPLTPEYLATVFDGEVIFEDPALALPK